MIGSWFKKKAPLAPEKTPKGAPTLARGATVDICLLLEGTYPFIRGGVSAWVHQIIRNLPEFTFGLVFLGGSRSDYGPMKYELPKNVLHLECHYLSESWTLAKAKPTKGRKDSFEDVARMHEYFKDPKSGLPDGLLQRVFASIGSKKGITRDDFLFSEASWDRISEDYRNHCSDPSFVDYFWTVRIMHAPLFMLAEVARGAPSSRAFHSVSTGYAGALGAFLHESRKRPLILSEHGIYTKERKIELAQAAWIKDAKEVFGGGLGDDLSYMRRLWIRFFEGLGRLTYEASDPIIALYEGNRLRQVKDGARAERTCVVPNGIDLKRFEPLQAKRPERVPPILGLIGRVVPIKDIKTFVRTMHTVVARVPEAEGWIVGPEDEDAAYAKECHDLVESLGLQNKVKFLGFQNVAEIMPKLGLMVLTSISEALPLVVVEGFASGLPALTTDVGSCSELIHGSTPEDKALGSAGAVVPIADAEAAGNAAVRLLADEAVWRSAQQAAMERVRRYYAEPDMIDRYRTIYRSATGTTG